jgi:holo-[acyl-carrier protein] synthase
MTGMGVRIGLDLAAVAAVRDAIDAHGDRYLQRVYTDRELNDSCILGRVEPRLLAARFAAKEAMLKVLSPQNGISLREIEVHVEGSNPPQLHLGGYAATLATEAGIVGIRLSLSTVAEFAAALVLADYG